MGEHRRRIRSPPRPRNRVTEENRIQPSNRSRVEPIRSRMLGSTCSRLYEVNQDDDKDGYARKLSQFNETLPRGELTSTKFEWANLMADKPEKSDSGRIPTENDNVVGFNKSQRLYSLCPTIRDYDCSNNGAVFPSGRYHPVVNENVERGLYKEEEKLGFFSKDGLFPHTRTPVSNSSAMRFCLSSMEGREQRSEYDGLYRSMTSVQDDYRAPSSVRTSIVDSIVGKLDGTNNSKNWETERNRSLYDQHLHVGKESITMEQGGEYSSARTSHISRGSEVMEQAGEHSGSGSRSFRVECGLEVNLDNGILQVGEDNGFRSDGCLGSYEPGLKRLPLSDQDILYENEERFQQMLVEEEDQSEKVLKRGRVVDLRMITQNTKHKLSLDCISSHENYYPANVDEQWTSEDTERFSLLKNLEFDQALDEMSGHNLSSSPFLPVSVQEHSSDHVKNSSMDIKKRLGPARNIMERLGPAQNKKRVRRSRKPVNKKYLRLARNGLISLPCSKSSIQNKFTERNLDDFDDRVYVQGNDYFEVEMKSSKTEALEHTEHFEKLVHTAFMKFVKALNENTAQQRKFTERGGKCTLKCSVCCRNSKEFMDTLSLVQHAFTSKKVGLRAEHLGFHRALCVLMGWNYAATPNRLWVPQVLPYAEALALKQNLIIWPPVVFVHNSSIANTNPDERIIVSIEELQYIIRGMGLGRGITKVCHGRAANQSTMVVNFYGTFPGLQEAERLHKLYAENKHGRAEFEQITFQRSSKGDKTHNADKVESVLYGYLGIAEDLDKLDFEAKRRCFVKSKKEILTIVDTPFDSE